MKGSVNSNIPIAPVRKYLNTKGKLKVRKPSEFVMGNFLPLTPPRYCTVPLTLNAVDSQSRNDNWAIIKVRPIEIPVN